ncbi:MAG: homoserine kinase [Deltaproteobacteria bacterium]|nr:homoserine kinase [Deltaproteobacteria bacterium]
MSISKLKTCYLIPKLRFLLAVYTQIDDDTLAHMLSIYPACGEFIRAEGVAAGSINSIFRTFTSTGTFYVRVSEGQPLQDLMRERALLDFLHQNHSRLGCTFAPHMQKNVAKGTFFPVVKGQWAAIFDELKGRELAVFELQPEHLADLGDYLARAHLVLRKAKLRCKNPNGVLRMQQWMRKLDDQLPDRVLFRQLEKSFQQVLRIRKKHLLPRGVIHGDLFLNNTKWQKGRLSAVFDWEMAGTDQLLLDVAIVICAWCWVRSQPANPSQQTDPSTNADSIKGHFRQDLVQAFLQAYQRVRSFSPQERRCLPNELRLAALRFTSSRVVDFELPRSTDAEREFLDYREFWDRYQAIAGRRDRELRAMWL